jgi:hypothetical protein
MKTCRLYNNNFKRVSSCGDLESRHIDRQEEELGEISKVQKLKPSNKMKNRSGTSFKGNVSRINGDS